MNTLSRRQFLLGAGATATVGAAALLGSDIATTEAAEDGQAVRVRRWAMVIDLRSCDGCADQGVPPQCTQYCVWGHSIPEGQQWIEVYRFDEAEDVPNSDFQFMPVPCQQCQNAPCTNVCPVGATFATPEGVVLIDQQRCIGCRLCMAACPYDRRFFNWKEPDQLPQIKNSTYDIYQETPAIRGTVMKCNFCPERTAAGGLPICVEACPHGAIYFGDLEEDIATNGDEIVQLSRFLHQNNAFRYKAELGTEPRVWYIPGHTHKGEVREDAERSFPTDTGDTFLKAKLEWPWRDIMVRMEQDALPAMATNAEGM